MPFVGVTVSTKKEYNTPPIIHIVVTKIKYLNTGEILRSEGRKHPTLYYNSEHTAGVYYI